MNHPKHAFTLVELSIVLVIIALIVGGVLTGKDLIREGQYRKQISSLREIQAAHFTFVQKYNCMPGDCKNLSDYFVPLAALNGNGDQLVQCWYGGIPDECNTYFYSLVLAGLSNVQTAVPGSPVTAYYKGVLNTASMYVNYVDRYNPLIGRGSKAVIHLFKINNPWASGGIFSPEDTWRLDIKYDDGDPAKGRMLAVTGQDDLGNAQTCVSSGAYITTQTTIGCRLDFVIE